MADCSQSAGTLVGHGEAPSGHGKTGHGPGMGVAEKRDSAASGRQACFAPRLLFGNSGVLLSATLTLLFLIIGFSFSMAINRYDLRKNCEQAEAVAIGRQYSRGDLLTPRTERRCSRS
jgi:hypothetical protein